MREREFEGADLEAALHTASERLGVPEAELDYEIVEQGRRGLFGLGRKNVRIRVMPPLDDEIPDPDRAPRRGRPRRERKPAAARQAAAGQAAAGQAAAEGSAPRRKSRNRRRRERTRRPPVAESAAPSEIATDAAAPRRPESDRQAQRGNGRRRSRSRSRKAPGADRGPAAAPTRGRAPAPPADPEQIAAVQATLGQMIELMGLEVAINPGTGGGVQLELDGPDRKALVSRDAELLGALQFVLNRMSRRAWPGTGRIHLTCNGQPTRRDDDIVGIVEQAIEAVQRTGAPQHLREMNAYERRLVHIAVRKAAGVESSSEGDGHLKRVRIIATGAGEAAQPAEPAESAEPVESAEPPQDDAVEGQRPSEPQAD